MLHTLYCFKHQSLTSFSNSPTTSQYPEVLLPTRTIKPSFLSSANRFLIVFSDKAKSSLNCLIVMFGFCMINSNVLWAIFGKSLGNLWVLFVQSLCNLCAIFMQVLLLFLQSNHISTSFMHCIFKGMIYLY